MDLFWKPWKDDKKTIWLASSLTFAFTMVLMGLYINFQDNPDEQSRSMIYILMLIFGAMFGLADWGRRNQSHPAVEYVHFGTINKAVISGIVGVIFALFVAGTLFVSTPFAVPEIGGINLMFFYLVLVAPYAEEKFFASTVAPTAYKHFTPILGLLITSGFFAFYHGFAYGWEENKMMVAGIWRAAVLMGNQVFRSTNFGVMAHVTNNWLAYNLLVA